MNIDQLKGNNFTPKKSDRSNASSETSKTGDSSGTSKSSPAGKSDSATNLSLSGSTFENEVDFTRKLLANAKQESFASLKKIKQKINSNAYNNEEVHKKISTLVTKDLTSLQEVIAHSPDGKRTDATLSTEHKRSLLENPEVNQKIAERIIGDLRRL